ncbi:MAG: pantoate--beta-alanine ligase [Bacteroidales bacterium]
MKTVETVSGVRQQLDGIDPSLIGFVPTMGALHEGHLSLALRAVNECRRVVVSIFVNPTQFNDKDDLKNYPRTIPGDLKLLGTVLRADDLVFIPSVKEIYPSEDKRIFSFGTLDKVMEGAHRPGHFNGVAQVVSRLFDIVSPGIAYFGQKDFQQLTIIKDLVRQHGYDIKIIACPIIREPDGLAMSSRNRLLEPEIRKNAPVIFKTISEAASIVNSTEINQVKEFVTGKVNSINGYSLEYFEIVDDVSLIPVNTRKDMLPGKKYYGCIAVKAGKIRLIDNIEIPLH